MIAVEVGVNLVYPEPPAFAEGCPTRAVYIGDAGGRCEVFAWDTSSAEAWQLTDRPHGTVSCAIDPSGEQVWWFDDDLSGIGVWRVQPFDGSSPATLAGFPSGRSVGLAMAMDGTVVAGIADDRGVKIYRRRPADAIELLIARAEYCQLVDVSGSGDEIVLAGEPDSADAVEVFCAATGEFSRLAGSPHPLWATGFAPAPAAAAVSDPLLLSVQAADGYRLAVWTRQAGLSVLDWCVFDTEIAPSWYPDGRRVLVRQNRHARSLLQAVDLSERSRTVLDTPAGSILAATVQPDGDVHYVCTDSTRPPRLQTSSGRRPPATTGAAERQPGTRSDAWVPTPNGPVHTLLALPESPGPHPGVFLLHGGPFEAAMDAYDPMVSVFLSIGCAVIRPNYRGSTGYGQAWRQDFSAGVGLTQLEDLSAVHEFLVADGTIRAGRTAVCGESWGGYLALLAAGVQPELWQAVAAVNPIADYSAAFRDSTAAVRSLDTRLFGGTPDECPLEYARSSPSSYVHRVRAATLVLAGTDDPKCPPAQIQAYADQLRSCGVTAELGWLESGHEGYRADVLVEILGRVVTFVGTALGGRAELQTSVSG